MSTSDQPNEEELRAAYEAQLKKIRVEQIVLEQVISLINLGMRRTGLSPETEDERDIDQVRVAIESVRALMPVVEQIAAPQAGQIREALSQLQMAYVRLGGGGPAAAGAPAPPAGEPGAPGSGSGEEPRPGGPAEPAPGAQPGGAQSGEGGPAQRSGRLWVPGQ